jgi:hypothetical protein
LGNDEQAGEDSWSKKQEGEKEEDDCWRDDDWHSYEAFRNEEEVVKLDGIEPACS